MMLHKKNFDVEKNLAPGLAHVRHRPALMPHCHGSIEVAKILKLGCTRTCRCRSAGCRRRSSTRT
ncbi:MAG: hypothetical protein ACLSVD_11830 [Eggerthellaceae bacterium]